MKKVIKITESQIHNVIKESINKIISEIQFGGESLHGSTPADWKTLALLRHNLADYYENGESFFSDDPDYKVDYNKVRKNNSSYWDASEQFQSYFPKNKPSQYSEPYEIQNGIDKANRIAKRKTGSPLPNDY